MRLYAKKIIRNRIGRQLEGKIETRDAIVWQVYPEQRVAEVRIQGSDTSIIAQYPLNWETTPVWLKRGNSAKINFVSGNQGRKELIGHGATVPTPVGTAPFSPITGDDGWISGGEATPTSTPSMDVDVSAGSVRIDGEIYDFGADTITVSAPPAAGNYRYDLIVVGADGVIDYVEGTPSSSEPAIPAVPADHVLLRRILVWHNSSTINSVNIGTSWVAPFANSLSMSFSKDHMHWEDAGSSTITVQVVDQYGEGISPASAGYESYDFTLTWVAGNGNLDGVPAQTPATNPDIGISSTTFAYTRNNLVTDATPVFHATVNTVPVYFTTGQILLLNDLDQEMWGEAGAIVIGPVGGSTAGNIPQFSDTSGQNIEDSGISIDDVEAALEASHTQGTDQTLDAGGPNEVSAEEIREFLDTYVPESGGAAGLSNLTLFPEFPGAVMTASGSDNDPGEEGMTSDFESISNTIYNYYEWSSDVEDGLQSYDINLKIPIPLGFVSIPEGTNEALTIDIKTEEDEGTNNAIDVTIQRDGNAATSALSGQYSASAATWETIGFNDSNAVLAALVAGDVLNVKVRLYSQASKYARVGKINLQMTVQ